MKLGLLGLSMLAIGASANAALINYTDYNAWANDTDGYATLKFTTVPDGSIGSYYAGQGATFEANDVALTNASFSDNKGVNGGGNGIVVTFAEAQLAVGTHFPGATRLSLYSGNTLVGVSDNFGGQGNPFFGGVRSSVAFDKVVIDDWFDMQFGGNDVYIDNLYYTSNCEAVPEPASMAALGLGVAALVRRRRK